LPNLLNSKISTQNFFVSSGLGGELFWAKRAGIQKAKSKILKKFSSFLTLYFTMTYALHYPLYAICYPLFFVPIAQLRPFIEDAVFLSLVFNFKFWF